MAAKVTFALTSRVKPSWPTVTFDATVVSSSPAARPAVLKFCLTPWQDRPLHVLCSSCSIWVQPEGCMGCGTNEKYPKALIWMDLENYETLEDFLHAWLSLFLEPLGSLEAGYNANLLTEIVMQLRSEAKSFPRTGRNVMARALAEASTCTLLTAF